VKLSVTYLYNNRVGHNMATMDCGRCGKQKYAFTIKEGWIMLRDGKTLKKLEDGVRICEDCNLELDPLRGE